MLRMQPKKKEEAFLPKDSVRERLLKSAITLFAQKGYAAASVNNIVDLAGVTKPVLYYHFGNKEGIYTELLRKAKSDFLGVLADPKAEPDPLKRLVLLCTRVLSLSLENLDFVRFMNAIFYGPPQGGPAFDFESFHMTLFNAIRAHLQDAAHLGVLRAGKLEDQTWVILGGLSCCIEAQLCLPEQAPGSAGLQRMIGLIFRGIASERYWQETGPAPDSIGKPRSAASLPVSARPNRKRK
jgi:TetR/AcrR family transcriptional regulator